MSLTTFLWLCAVAVGIYGLVILSCLVWGVWAAMSAQRKKRIGAYAVGLVLLGIFYLAGIPPWAAWVLSAMATGGIITVQDRLIKEAQREAELCRLKDRIEELEKKVPDPADSLPPPVAKPVEGGPKTPSHVPFEYHSYPWMRRHPTPEEEERSMRLLLSHFKGAELLDDAAKLRIKTARHSWDQAQIEIDCAKIKRAFALLLPWTWKKRFSREQCSADPTTPGAPRQRNCNSFSGLNGPA